MKAVLIRWCLVLAVCPCGLLRLQAQTGDAAAVTGTVLDVAGKGIPNAAVSVRNESTGAARMAMSASDGKFSVTGLPVGTYSIEVSAPSFATSRRAGVKLPAGETETAAIALNVGELSQTVTGSWITRPTLTATGTSRTTTAKPSPRPAGWTNSTVIARWAMCWR
jgi:iron complex outermembrane receptor protein